MPCASFFDSAWTQRARGCAGKTVEFYKDDKVEMRQKSANKRMRLLSKKWKLASLIVLLLNGVVPYMPPQHMSPHGKGGPHMPYNSPNLVPPISPYIPYNPLEAMGAMTGSAVRNYMGVLVVP